MLCATWPGFSNAMRCNAMRCNSMRCDAMRCDASTALNREPIPQMRCAGRQGALPQAARLVGRECGRANFDHIRHEVVTHVCAFVCCVQLAATFALCVCLFALCVCLFALCVCLFALCVCLFALCVCSYFHTLGLSALPPKISVRLWDWVMVDGVQVGRV
jgi:hypothetical protein